MNCEQFEQLIALQVEGDLPVNQQGKLSRHLAICGSCHRFAEEIRDSQSSLRSYTGGDFDETLLAGIRQSVMAQIHNGEVSLSPFERIAKFLGISDFHRFIWAISGAAAMLVLVSTIGLYVFLKTGPNVDIAVKIPVLDLPSSVGVPNSVSQESDSKQTTTVRHYTIRRQPDFQRSVIADNRPMPLIPTISESTPAATVDMSQLIAADDPGVLTGPAPKKDVTRIEMQTANPNIRIIWFANKKPTAPPMAVLSDSE